MNARVAVAALLTAAAAAQEVADVSATLAAIVKEHEVPALGAAVLQKGRLVALGASGVRCLGKPEQVTADDLWHLGSCTKAMTAVVIGRLVEQGRLRFEQKLPELFPDRAEAMHAGWREATLRQLLDHRAGMPANSDVTTRALLHAAKDPQTGRKLLLDRILVAKPGRDPGTAYRYSNVGFAVAAAAAEQATNAAFEAKLEELLFKPLGMTSAGFGAPGKGEKPDQPWGHRLVRDELRPVPPGPGADNPPPMAPAGAVHCTLRDWAKFAALELGALPESKPPFLRAATLASLREPVTGSYACGMGVTKRPWSKGKVLSHSGSNTLWYCVIWLAPEEQFGVLVTCNAGGPAAERAGDAVAARMVKDYAGR